MTTMHRGWSEL